MQALMRQWRQRARCRSLLTSGRSSCVCGLSSSLRSAAVKGGPSSSGVGEELELQGAPWHSQVVPTMSPAELQCFRDRREEANNQLAQSNMPARGSMRRILLLRRRQRREPERQHVVMERLQAWMRCRPMATSGCRRPRLTWKRLRRSGHCSRGRARGHLAKGGGKGLQSQDFSSEPPLVGPAYSELMVLFGAGTAEDQQAVAQFRRRFEEKKRMDVDAHVFAAGGLQSGSAAVGGGGYCQRQ